MADIRLVNYWYAGVSDNPGEGARVLSVLQQAGINLLGFCGFPHGARKVQVDFVPEDAASFLKAARKAGLKLSKKKTGFLIQEEDHPGAVAEILGKLAGAKINVTAVQAACAGGGRYGALLWVKASDVKKAARALGAA